MRTIPSADSALALTVRTNDLIAVPVAELCPDAEAEIDGHEHGCPAAWANGMAEASE